MALTQMQLIQSLGEALAWFERERNWGVPATELRHLCGRIGELYAAMITNGQMAGTVNQPGYDVVSAEGERISVKTTAQTGYDGHISFRASTFDEVDRVMVLRINPEEMQVETLLDEPAALARTRLSGEGGARLNLPLRQLIRKCAPRTPALTVKEVQCDGHLIRELETGSIEVWRNGQAVIPAKPVLRDAAKALNISLLNSNGNPHTTRQLGTLVIRVLQEQQARAA